MSKGMLYSIVGGGSALVLAAVGITIWQVAPRTEAAVTAPTGFQTPAPAGPVALSTEADTSDEFDWWKLDRASDDVRFLASDEAHEDSLSLVVVSDSAQYEAPVAQLEQTVGAVAGVTYTISFWAKSVNAGADAVAVLPSQDGWSSRIAVPGGTYDWTFFSTDYTVGALESMLIFRIAVNGPTEGTWIDSVSIGETGTPNQTVNNNGFESSSADLTLSNSSLIFVEGAASLEVATRRSADGWISWSTRDINGEVALAGEELIAGYEASVDLAALTPGYYQLEITATLGDRVVTRETTLGVLAKGAAGDSANSLFGVSMHIQPNDRRQANLIDYLGSAGVAHARIETQWSQIENSIGTYAYPELYDTVVEEFKDAGIVPLLIAAYSNPNYDNGLTPSSSRGLEAFANYAADVVKHYSYAGQELEVYNEFDHTFNTGECGMTPECYLEMLTATANAVKKNNPDATIVAPGNSGMGLKLDWVQRLIDLGGLQSIDAVSAHPYVQPAPPEALIADLDSLRNILDSVGGESKPIWMTEMGWAAVPDWVTEDQQSDYLVRTLAIAAAHGVERVYWYTVADLGPNEIDRESNFGVFEAGSSLIPFTYAPKPAALAQAVMAQRLKNHEFTSSDDLGENSYSYVFEGPDSRMRIMWTSKETEVVVVASSEAVIVTDSLGKSAVHKPKSGKVEIELSGSPIYVDGKITSVGLGAQQ